MKKITKIIRSLQKHIRLNISNLFNFWRRVPRQRLAFYRSNVHNQLHHSYHRHAIREANRYEISTFHIIVIIACASLLILPFVSTFNEFITKIVLKVEMYRVLQEQLTPWMVKIVAGLLNALGIDSSCGVDRIYMYKGSDPLAVFISWNCIGWQSFILLLITFFVGLKGPFTLKSKLETVLIGILGTFLINIFRISFVSVVAYYFGQLAAIIFHDYISTLVMILWLVAYWLFSYRFILHHKDLAHVGHK